MLGKIESRRERGLTEDEEVGWHHQLNEHGVEQTQGDSEGQGSLVCCSPWGCKESDTTYQLGNDNWILTPVGRLLSQEALASCVLFLMMIPIQNPLPIHKCGENHEVI